MEKILLFPEESIDLSLWTIFDIAILPGQEKALVAILDKLQGGWAKSNDRIDENSRKLNFAPILTPFCPFYGKQKFSWKIDFHHLFLFQNFYRYANFRKT